MASVLVRNQWVVFITTWVAYAIVYFLRKPLGVIKPSLETEFKLTRTDLGWLDVGLLLPYSIVQLTSSNISDKFGARLTISMCLTIAGTAMVTFGFWSSYWMLVLVMGINGAMQGPCWPASCKAVCAWFPDSKLNSTVGFLSTSVFVGGALGTFLAVHLQSEYGWRMVHVPVGIAAVVISLVVYCVLKSPEERHIVVPGKEAVIGSLQSLSEQKPKKLLWHLLKLPAVLEISLTVFCLKTVRYCMSLWLPMYLVHNLTYSVARAGLFSTLFDVGGSVGSPAIGYILDKKFKKSVMLGMWIFVSLSSISLAFFAMTAQWGFAYNAVFMFFAGATNGGADSLLAGSVSMKIGEANGMKLGAAVTGLVNGVGTLGAVLQGPVTGFIADAYGWDAMFTLMILVSGAASLMVLRALTIMRRIERNKGIIGAAAKEDRVPLVS